MTCASFNDLLRVVGSAAKPASTAPRCLPPPHPPPHLPPNPLQSQLLKSQSSLPADTAAQHAATAAHKANAPRRIHPAKLGSQE